MRCVFVRIRTRILPTCFLLLMFFLFVPAQQQQNDKMPSVEIKNWATRFGVQIWEVSKKATRLVQLKQRFHDRSAKIVKKDGLQLVKEMADDVSDMMKMKIDSVLRVLDSAEEMFAECPLEPKTKHSFIHAKQRSKEEEQNADPEYQLHPEKELITNLRSAHFDGRMINISEAAYHVPTNVYEGAPDVIGAIKCSEKLKHIFEQNYWTDPSLSWQYFASSTGFMMLYPATAWPSGEDNDPDLYDCRMRPWYTQAAAGPKDMVILLDTSGSMTGLRKEISKHVVHTILETLTANDFVNIYKFSENTTELVPCFTDTLVQGNLENVRKLKSALEGLATAKIADFEKALVKAFELLKLHKDSNRTAGSSGCSQAIMIVTDGAPYNFKEIFKTYNWPSKEVRVFTYLIGREVTDVREVRWMACANKGYFTQVATQAEVQEQVMKYIPVMARPMVLYRTNHSMVWTQVYADLADPRRTNWEWEHRERERQRARSDNYRLFLKEFNSVKEPGPKFFNPVEIDKFLTYRNWETKDSEITSKNLEQEARERTRALRRGKYAGYQFMTSVAMPVFDRRNHSATKEKIANLLGVAGTDVPIREIEKRVPAYQLGVNGYSFIVSNNGDILYHRDFRPVFQDILKPNYNSVDLAEVELVENAETPRFNDSSLYTLRKEMVDQRVGEIDMNVTIHMDEMKRVTTRKQKYFYHPIQYTPFSLGIALSDGYGQNRLEAAVEISLERKHDVADYFVGKNWRVHPEWVYCEYNFDITPGPGSPNISTPEERVMHFLRRIKTRDSEGKGWKWLSRRVRPVTRGFDREFLRKNEKRVPKDSYFCDKELFQSLVFDAMVTNGFDSKDHAYDKEEGQDFFLMHGITMAFVATRSGLTRWQDLSTWDDKDNSTGDMHFSDLHNRAIDEIWYRRAVDQHEIDPNSFVISVPFDAGTRNNSLVTGTYAIFHEHGGKKAPVAVVGLQFQYSAFVAMFHNITTRCERKEDCTKNCSNDSFFCYVLDSNGYVVISKNVEQTGRFFGEIEGTIMDSLIQDGIYKKVHVYDYQAVCLDIQPSGNFASFLMSPIQNLKWLWHWLVGNFAWMLVQTNLHLLWDPDWAIATSESTTPNPMPNDDATQLNDGEVMIVREGSQNINLAFIERTRVRPCDKEVDLYVLQPHRLPAEDSPTLFQGKLTNCHNSQCERTFIVQKIPHTNLILVLLDMQCLCESRLFSITPKEVAHVAENDSQACERMTTNWYRKRPDYCYSYHSEEVLIDDCGRGSHLHVPTVLLLTALLLTTVYRLQAFS